MVNPILNHTLTQTFNLSSDTFPNESLDSILSELDLKGIYSMRLTNRKFSQFISNNPPLWKKLLEKHFPHSYLNQNSFFSAPEVLYKEKHMQMTSNIKKGSYKLTTLKGHEDSVNVLEIYKNFLISGSRDCTIRIWDLIPNVFQ